MEQQSNFSSIGALQELLKKESDNLTSTSMDFSIFFPSLKYDWRTNLGSENPKSVNEFLQTTIYNAASRRTGMEIQRQTGLGQPGLEVEITGDQVPDAFYLEVYHWEYKPGATEKPLPLTPKIAVLTGNSLLPGGEKIMDYLRRLVVEGEATCDDQETAEGRVMTFDVPMPIPKFKVAGRIFSRKDGDKSNLMEISLDIKIPYQEVSNWLTEKQN